MGGVWVTGCISVGATEAMLFIFLTRSNCFRNVLPTSHMLTLHFFWRFSFTPRFHFLRQFAWVEPRRPQGSSSTGMPGSYPFMLCKFWLQHGVGRHNMPVLVHKARGVE